MPEAKRNLTENKESNLGLEGFENFFDGTGVELAEPGATTIGGLLPAQQVENLINLFSQLMTQTVNQKVEISTITSQLIDNQRQLIATQQILIRLMEKSIELTRHITAIEEKLPIVFEVPRTLEALRERVARLEGIEIA